MQTIILAAGRGTRLNYLTENCPKPLIKISGKPILEHTLSSLPPEIDEVVMVIGYLGEKIRKMFGNQFQGRNIKYVPLAHLLGTAYAVWQTRPLLREEKFLVLNGDDLYDRKELSKLIEHSLAFGLSKETPPSPKYISIDLDQ